MLNTAHIEETVIGVFALNLNGQVIEKALYVKEPKKIAKALLRQREGEITREVIKVVEGLKKRGFTSITTSNSELAEKLKTEYEFNMEIVTSGPTDRLKDELPTLAIKYGLIKNIDEFNELNVEVSNIIARETVQRMLSGRETIIIQTVQFLGELDTCLNAFSNRLKEWYGLHYPELNRLIRDHQTYANFVVEIGHRESIEEKKLKSIGLQSREFTSILQESMKSMGADFQYGDLDEVKVLASRVISLYDYRLKLTQYISNITEEVAPNISVLVGPVLAAKLIEKAGSLKRLAMMPASTIQIIGAEKALYRAVKTKARPPKHGIIFQHPYVNTAPRGLRGIRARHLAAKIAIAARADAFSGNLIADQLKKELNLN